MDRVYDYMLGGTHNFAADQAVGRMITAVEPNARAIGRANRAFLGRAVRFLVGAGFGYVSSILAGKLVAKAPAAESAPATA